MLVHAGERQWKACDFSSANRLKRKAAPELVLLSTSLVLSGFPGNDYEALQMYEKLNAQMESGGVFEIKIEGK